jgi:hypothetical protein
VGDVSTFKLCHAAASEAAGVQLDVACVSDSERARDAGIRVVACWHRLPISGLNRVASVGDHMRSRQALTV